MRVIDYPFPIQASELSQQLCLGCFIEVNTSYLRGIDLSFLLHFLFIGEVFDSGLGAPLITRRLVECLDSLVSLLDLK